MILMAETYDPSEVEERPRSQHFSKKEVRVLAIVIVVGLVLLYPVYMYLLGRRNVFVCKTHMKSVSQAFLLYAQDNSDMFPPVFVEAPGGDYPLEGPRGVNSWVTLLSRYVQGGNDVFFCPSAADENAVRNEDPNVEPDDPRPDEEKVILSTYGMFAGLSGQTVSSVTNQSETVLFSETNNLGTGGVYNPAAVHYIDAKGNRVSDGMVIGFDTTNLTGSFTQKELDDAKFVTRLAYPDTENGVFNPGGGGRHMDGINFGYVDGHIGNKPLKPPLARIPRLGRTSELQPPWNGGLR